MKILGVDPGTRVTGYGAVEVEGRKARMLTCGAIRTKSSDLPGRLREIFEGLQAVIAEVAPDCVSVEEAFYGRNVQSTIKIGEARAVALLVGALAGLPVFEYPAATVKKSVVGVGGAHKSQVQQMVRMILGLEAVPKPADAADALAIALCHAYRQGRRR
jgi:crossover junction endodeoxyribonuclease RuvC